jgi:hypothetical protein
MTKTEQNIEVILNSILIIEAKLDTIIEHTVSNEDMNDFNRNMHLHIADTRAKLYEYFGQLDLPKSELNPRFLV